MKKISVAAFVIASGGLAAIACQAQSQDWSGPYIAVFAGANQLSGSAETLDFDTDLDGAYGDTVHTFAGADAFSPGVCNGAANGKTPAAECYEDGNRATVGGRIGYDFQFGHLVMGALVEVNNLELTDSVAAFSTTPAAYSFSRSLESVMAIRARVGYGADDWLVYATGGTAQADIGRRFATTNAFNSFAATDGADTATGYQAGLGLERRISGRWSLGVEYLHTSLEDKGVTVHAGPSPNTFNSNPFLIVNPAGSDIRRSEDRIEFNTLMITLTCRFGAR